MSYGCEMPFVIRKSTIRQGNIYHYIGCRYVHGLMDEEALYDDELMDEEFRLHSGAF